VLVDAFVEAREGDAERGEVVQRCDRVLQVPAETVEAPHHEDINAQPAAAQ
jgi:hypothetical protein